MARRGQWMHGGMRYSAMPVARLRPVFGTAGGEGHLSISAQDFLARVDWLGSTPFGSGRKNTGLMEIKPMMISNVAEGCKTFDLCLPNIAFTYLANSGEKFETYSSGWCGALTHRVSQWLRAKDVLHKRLMITRAIEEGNDLYPSVSSQPKKIWYHAIIEVDGFIHCPWLDERLPVNDYCTKMFPGQAITIEEDYACCVSK